MYIQKKKDVAATMDELYDGWMENPDFEIPVESPFFSSGWEVSGKQNMQTIYAGCTSEESMHCHCSVL